MKPSDLAWVVINTTVQPKAVTFPTDAKLLNRARERLVRLAKKLGLSLLEQERRQRGRKVYSLHAPEVECIGKGKTHRPYEFRVKVSIATTVKHSAGGRFVTHAIPMTGTRSARSFRRCKRSSATSSIAASPMPAIAATTPQVQGLHQRPEAPRHAADQARIQTAGRHRARHRPPQGAPPHGPQLPRMPAATPSTSCSPPLATTFAASSHG
jgi:IS5 family transposase